MALICDTNIWYRLGDGRLSESDFEGYDIVATGVNVVELYTSPMMLDDPESWQGAIKAITKYSSRYIEYDPIDFILSTSTSVHEPKSREEHIELGKRLQIMSKVDLKSINNDMDLVNQQRDFIDNYDADKQKIIDDLNGIIHNQNKRIRQKYQKSEFRKKRTVPEILAMIIDVFSERHGFKIEDQTQIDWNNFSMFIHGWDTYFKEKSLDPNNKFDPNDFYDLSNLAYVQKTDLYWTKDAKEPYASMKRNPATSDLFFNG